MIGLPEQVQAVPAEALMVKMLGAVSNWSPKLVAVPPKVWRLVGLRPLCLRALCKICCCD